MKWYKASWGRTTLAPSLEALAAVERVSELRGPKLDVGVPPGVAARPSAAAPGGSSG